jgi:hypothetical protein
MLGLAPFLHANGVDFSDDSTKVHLASWNGSEHPIDEFYAGTFNAWQEHQTRRNFECNFVLSLIDLGNREWLFAGVYEVVGSKSHPKIGEHILYSLRLLENQAELSGRIIVSHSRTRQSYIWLKAEIVLPIVEIRREPMTIADFPGYNAVVISHQTLQTIVKQKIPSWHKPLEHIKGIYLITNKATGKHYVGKASGTVGIWQRWCAYATNGHGGNVELKRLINEHGVEYAHNFQYSILEIADTHASEFDILKRESYWMDALQTRRFGMNGSKR